MSWVRGIGSRPPSRLPILADRLTQREPEIHVRDYLASPFRQYGCIPSGRLAVTPTPGRYPVTVVTCNCGSAMICDGQNRSVSHCL